MNMADKLELALFDKIISRLAERVGHGRPVPPPPLRKARRSAAGNVPVQKALWQEWREQDSRWIPVGWLEPGYASDPPQFDPLSGEVQRTPAFPISEFKSEPKNETIDVVYTLGTGSKHDDAELRYSLRSVATYFENLGRVWIVGHLPSWVATDQVIHVPMPDKCGMKDVNIIRKLLVACVSSHIDPPLSDRFVFFSDDQVLLRPVGWKQFGPYHRGDLAERKRWTTTWWKRMENTRNVLAAHGRPTWHGDTHIPLPMFRKTFVRVCHEADYRRPPGLCVGTLYLNWVKANAQPLGEHKATIEGALPTSEMRRRLGGRWFLGYNGAGFTSNLRTLLDELLPKKCRFEKESENAQINVHSAGPTLSIIIPTIGRPTLKQTLDSIRSQQLTDGDEIILVQDGPEKAATRHVFEESRLPGKYLGLDRHYGDIGGTPRNRGIAEAGGEYLAFIDDDDRYTSGAFDRIRRGAKAHPKRPMLFRMERPGWAPTLWRDKTVRVGNVSTQMFVVPNDPQRLGTWGTQDAGDLAFVCTTLAKYPSGAIVWIPDIVSIVPQESSQPLHSRAVTRNLIYHIYPVASNREWKENVNRLVQSWQLFNGRRIVGIVTDNRTSPISEVQKAFPGDSEIEWIVTPNHPERSESLTFLPAISSLRSYSLSEATFYAHAKGVSEKYHAPGWGRKKMAMRRWRDFMYRFLLEGIPIAKLDRLLHSYGCVGCLRRFGYFNPEPDRPPCLWHFSGTFFWLQHAAFFAHPNAMQLGQSYYAVERHPSEVFSESEAFCVAGDHIERFGRFTSDQSRETWKMFEREGLHSIAKM